MSSTDTVRNASENRCGRDTRPRRSTNSWSKCVRPRARSCRTDSMRVIVVCPSPHAAAQLHAPVVFRPRHEVRHQVDPERATRAKHSMHGFQRGIQRRIVEQRLEDAVGCGDQAEAGRGKRQEPHVAAHEVKRPLELRAAQALPGPVQHRGRSVDPDHARPCPRDGNRHAAGPAAELEDGTGRSGGQALPEPYVAASHRLGVLPVVEPRVVVPAAPAFHVIGPAAAGVRTWRPAPPTCWCRCP